MSLQFIQEVILFVERVFVDEVFVAQKHTVDGVLRIYAVQTSFFFGFNLLLSDLHLFTLLLFFCFLQLLWQLFI